MKKYELEDFLAAQKTAFGLSPIKALMELLKDERKCNTMITIRPSGVVNFFDNKLAWAVNQILGVSFGNNDATVIGSAVHAGADAGYRYKMDHGKLPDIRFCLMAVAKEARAQNKWNEQSKMTLNQIYKEAKRLFVVYYDEVMPRVKPTISEERIAYQFTDDNGNPLGIQLAGTPDRISEVDGELVVRDLKTSAKGIGGKKAAVPEKLVALRAELKELMKRPKKSEEQVALEEELKLAKRRPRDSEALTELKAALKEQGKIIKAKRTSEEDRESAQLRAAELDEEIKELEDLKEKTWLANLGTVETKLEAYRRELEDSRNAKIQALEKEIEPLQQKLDEEQYVNDCEAARRKHGLQLAAYALLAQIVTGKQIDKGVIELVVRYKDEPKCFTYEFDLTDYKLMLDEQLEIMISTIKAYRSGVDPSILFTLNPETFRGSELTEMIFNIRDLEDEDNLMAA